MATNFQINGTDFEDTYVKRDVFIEGGLWLWGGGFINGGQIGDNVLVHRSSPVQTVSGGNNWKQVSCGNWMTEAIKSDGSFWIWGYNGTGELGTNNTTNYSSPVQTVSAGTNWRTVSTGSCAGSHTAAIKTDGTLWSWGVTSFGELGDNTVANRSSPVQTISAGTNWKQVATGPYLTASIKTDGSLWTWGYNDYGQLGTNDRTHRSSPVQTVSTGTNWKQIAIGGYHMAAIKTDGTLWLWGLNTNGQLGTNDRTHRSSPVQTVSGGTNWKTVACGLGHTAAIKTDGTLWLWGVNTNGELGDNTITHKSSPVQTVSGGTNWKQASAYSHTVAIKTDGTLWNWGINTYGQLGDNTIVRKSSPIQTVAGGTDWKKIAAGAYHTAAIRENTW